MRDLVEIRWHGRGGQGVKTAAVLLAEAALDEGKYSQGYPEYGPERMGAPVRGYTRISSEPILLHSPINRPNIVVVLDQTLITAEDVAEGLQEDGSILVNTPCDPEVVAKQLKLNKNQKVYTIDANMISLQELGQVIPNTPMIGALVRIGKFMKLETILESLRHKFEKKFKSKVVEGNLKAIERAYNEVRGVS